MAILEENKEGTYVGNIDRIYLYAVVFYHISYNFRNKLYTPETF